MDELEVPRIRVLIVDDHPVFRHGLRDILDSNTDVEWVGECTSAAETLRAVPALRPDVILMDIRLPGRDGKGTNGFEATALIKRNSPQVKIIMLSMLDSMEAVHSAFEAGANGYLIKDAGKRDLLDAIHEVMEGGTPISPHIRGLGKSLIPQASKPANQPMDESTQRLRDIMELLAQGLTNDEMARRLVLAPKTIRNYVSNVIKLVGAVSRRDAITKLREMGYGLKKAGSPA